MADIQALEKALHNAHNAGDEDAARQLAGEIKKLTAKPSAPTATDKFNEMPWWKQGLVAADDTARNIVNGATFGFADKFASYMGGTPLEEERQKSADARERSGLAGALTEIGGSVATGGLAARAGLTAARIPGAVGRFGGAAIDGAGFGALNAVGNDQDIGTGAAIGGALGAGGQAAVKAGSTILRPLTSRWNPGAAANRVMADTMESAGATPQTLSADLSMAQRDGQGVYAIADALGHPGQRLASTVARTPNEGRTGLVEALEQRQGGQGRRIANALSEGFAAPDTAAQRAASLTTARNSAADAGYGSARQAAQDVDVMPAVTAIDNLLGGGNVKGAMGIAPDSIEGALLNIRSKLTNQDGTAQVVGFDEILRAKQNLDDVIGKAARAGEGNKVRLLTGIRQRLDHALEAASGPYASARNQFRSDSRAIDAIDTGRAASMRGRTEDTIPAFQGMQPNEQAAFRAGYVDPLIERTQGAAVGSNKARPLINDATNAEFPAFAAPGRGPQLGARIRREQTMFETRNAALGGSKTADNLADEAALSSVDPSVIGNVLSGNWAGAIKSGLMQGVSALKGQPASVRRRMAEMLMETNPQAARQIAISARNAKISSQTKAAAIARALMIGGTTTAMEYQN